MPFYDLSNCLGPCFWLGGFAEHFSCTVCGEVIMMCISLPFQREGSGLLNSNLQQVCGGLQAGKGFQEVQVSPFCLPKSYCSYLRSCTQHMAPMVFVVCACTHSVHHSSIRSVAHVSSA